jgi:hypothetical protein
MTAAELADILRRQLTDLFQDDFPSVTILAQSFRQATLEFVLADRKFQTGLRKAIRRFARESRWPPPLPWFLGS